MNLFRSNSPPRRVPTLTEVVDLVPVDPEEAAFLEAASGGEVNAQPQANGAVAAPPAHPAASALAEAAGDPAELLLTQEELVRQIMADVQRQVDAMLEVRMKEALAPAITRFTDALARDTRAELGSVLKDVVTRAVSQALTGRFGG